MADPRQPCERVDTGSPGKDEWAHGDGDVPCSQTGRGELGSAVYLAKGKGVDEEGDEDGRDALTVSLTI